MKSPKPSKTSAANRPAKSSPSNQAGAKKPLSRRDDPFARDSRGKATRDEVRKMTPAVNAPRQSNRPSKHSK